MEGTSQELESQIMIALKSSPLTESWTIEKVTVLDETNVEIPAETNRGT
jgi:hypothetical protein